MSSSIHRENSIQPAPGQQHSPVSDDSWASRTHANACSAADEASREAGKDSPYFEALWANAYFIHFKRSLNERQTTDDDHIRRLIDLMEDKLFYGVKGNYVEAGLSDAGAASIANRLTALFTRRCDRELLGKAPAAEDAIAGASSSRKPSNRKGETALAPSRPKKKLSDKNVYGRKTWSGWSASKSSLPDPAAAQYMSARENFKDATGTHSKRLVAASIFLMGVGAVLMAPLAFSTISDICKPDAHNPRGCRNSKTAAAGAVLICAAGIIAGFSLFVSDQRKKKRAKNYADFHTV